MTSDTTASTDRKGSRRKPKKIVKGLSKSIRSLYTTGNVHYRIAAGSSKQAPVLFVWIPKTAGTSLFAALESQMGMVQLSRSFSHVKAFKNRGAVTFGHYHYRSLLSAGIVSQAFHDAAFKFCVVRDPYDRALSLYHYLRRKKGRSAQTLLQFLDDVYRIRPPVGLYSYLGLSQANPQVDWLMDDDGGFVVDRIYRFEKLEEIRDDFRRLFSIPDFDIGHENRVPRDTSAGEILSSHSEIVPLIEEIYARDFHLLGYEKRAPAA